MNHYELDDVLQHVYTCERLGCVPLGELDYFRALVDQANCAESEQRDKERMLGRLLAAGIIDIVEREQ